MPSSVPPVRLGDRQPLHRVNLRRSLVAHLAYVFSSTGLLVDFLLALAIGGLGFLTGAVLRFASTAVRRHLSAT